MRARGRAAGGTAATIAAAPRFGLVRAADPAGAHALPAAPGRGNLPGTREEAAP